MDVADPLFSAQTPKGLLDGLGDFVRRRRLWPVRVECTVRTPSSEPKGTPGEVPDCRAALRGLKGMDDDFGLLTYGNAWPTVKRLAEVYGEAEEEKLIEFLNRKYPDVARAVGLAAP